MNNGVGVKVIGYSNLKAKLRDFNISNRGKGYKKHNPDELLVIKPHQFDEATRVEKPRETSERIVRVRTVAKK